MAEATAHGARAWQRGMVALALGAAMAFFSEMLFWSAPHPGDSAATFLLVWMFYSLAVWAALVASAWAGPGGLAGLFLAGSMAGWLVEGLAVDQLYSALPFSILWTPMAWHALISVILGLWLVRRAAGWRPARQVTFLIAFGAMLGVWAWYWPLERAVPPPGTTFAYLVGAGLVLPVANLVLDHLPRRYPYRRGEARAALAVVALIWALKLAVSLNVALVTLSALCLATLWLMRRIGHGSAPFALPPAPRHPARHWLAMLIPLTAWGVAQAGWRAFPAGIAVNVVFALGLSAAALGLTALALWQGLRSSR